ncbi:hypothetical protein ACIPWI_30010 [Streptomyces sp. NPDC090046]|uniref:hypothetical protein n=1 Tax=Streptomyces sp. NPDC090046 TaxID=3365928 RepID=UPI00381E4B66
MRLVNASAWYWCLRGRIGDARGALESALACAAAEGGQAAAAGADVDGARARPAAFAVLAGDGSLLDGGLETDPDGGFDGADPRGRWLLEYARLGFAGGAGRSDAPADAVLDGPIAVFRNLGDRWGEAAALSTLATRALYRGDLAELRRNAEAGSRLFGELGDQWGRLQDSEQLGILAEIDGDYAEAARLHEDGVRSARELELWTQVSFRLSRQGRIALLTGDTALAADLHGRAGRLSEEQLPRPAQQFAEIGLALGARRYGDLDADEARLRPWLEWNRRLGVEIGVALIPAQLGYVAEMRGDAPLAESLHRDGLAAARRSGDPRALALSPGRPDRTHRAHQRHRSHGPGRCAAAVTVDAGPDGAGPVELPRRNRVGAGAEPGRDRVGTRVVFPAKSWHGPDRLLTLHDACGTLPARTPHTL